MEGSSADQRSQQVYWDHLVLLKVVACDVRYYRDEQAWWISRIGLFKAL